MRSTIRERRSSERVESLLVSGHKKAPTFQNIQGFLLKFFLGLSLGNFTCLDCLNGNPHTLDLTARQLDSDALNIRTEFPACVLN